MSEDYSKAGTDQHRGASSINLYSSADNKTTTVYGGGLTLFTTPFQSCFFLSTPQRRARATEKHAFNTIVLSRVCPSLLELVLAAVSPFCCRETGVGNPVPGHTHQHTDQAETQMFSLLLVTGPSYKHLLESAEQQKYCNNSPLKEKLAALGRLSHLQPIMTLQSSSDASCRQHSFPMPVEHSEIHCIIAQVCVVTMRVSAVVRMYTYIGIAGTG